MDWCSSSAGRDLWRGPLRPREGTSYPTHQINNNNRDWKIGTIICCEPTVRGLRATTYPAFFECSSYHFGADAFGSAPHPQWHQSDHLIPRLSRRKWIPPRRCWPRARRSGDVHRVSVRANFRGLPLDTGRSVRAGGRNVVQHRMGSCHGPGHAVANQIFDDDHVSGETPPQPRDLRNDSARGDLRPSQTFPVCRTAFAFGRSRRFGLFGKFLSVGHLTLGPPAIVIGDGTSLKDKEAIDRAHLVQLHLVPKQGRRRRPR